MALKCHLPYFDAALVSLEYKLPASLKPGFDARGLPILLSLVQFVLMVVIAAYLTGVCVALDRRNHRTWERLAARYDPGPGRLSTFSNAGILLEMVDYACRAEQHIDVFMAETLRREAMKARIEAVLGSGPWA